ncbi:helix-turn-helix domain-containing protein [Streptosporangium sp. NPDC051023]|uniref:nSTAND1 domain-containing NTPase n=1 Tax=Streptosporangium sp. NPDC051023 TaxID=3155410 RepID=UPI0034510D23
MSDPVSAETGSPDPARIRSRQDFGRELSLLREQAGLTVRQVAAKVGTRSAHSTIGDWFAGRGLPATASRDLLVRVLEACGAGDAESAGRWLEAWRRVRQAPGRRPPGPAPYRGLAGFGAEDSGWFFGREALTRELVAKVARLNAQGGGLQMVVGTSGSGKSSLLQAGLVAALRAGVVPGAPGGPGGPGGPGRTGAAAVAARGTAPPPVSGGTAWQVLSLSPGAHPADELGARLAALTGESAETVATRLRGEPGLADGDAPRAGGPPARLVVVVDQFEELFTVCAEEEERRRYVDALCTAGRGAVVVIGMRADFYAHALRHPPLVAAVQTGQLAVGPMSEAELREAIAAPAAKARVEIEEGLVELLLREMSGWDGRAEGHAHDAGALPLLSHALYATWRQGQGRRMTIADYRSIGGIGDAVAASADLVYDGLTAAQRETARRLFLTLTHIGADTADTRRRVAVTELLTHGGAETPHVLGRFIEQRLITADTATVEISHEALLGAWPRLRAWLDTDREGLVIGRRLAEAAAVWRAERRDPAALYRGARLAAAREWAVTAGPYTEPGLREQEFLDASARQEHDERLALRRGARRLRRLTAGLSLLLLLACAGGVAAVLSTLEAREQRDAALSRKVAQESGTLRVSDPALAAQLGLAAFRLAPTTEARGNLLSTFGTPYAILLRGHTDYVHDVALSTDGRLLASASVDRTVRLWDLSDPHRPKARGVLTGYGSFVGAVAFNPGGRLLATGGGDRTMRLWDLSDPRTPVLLTALTGYGDFAGALAFTPDGRFLATGGDDHTVRLWDLADPRAPKPAATMTGHTASVEGLAISGHTLVSASFDRTIRLWDITDPRHPALSAVAAGHKDGLLSVEFSRDGRRLVTTSADRTAGLWDVTDPRRPRREGTLTGNGGPVYSAAFAPDGRTVATGGDDATTRLWDVTDPRHPRELTVLTGHPGSPIDTNAVSAVVFSPDGHTLATGSYDHTIRLWDLPGPILIPGTRPDRFTSDGRVLVAQDRGTARWWDVGDPFRPAGRVLIAGTGVVAAGQDGRLMATGGPGSAVRLWHLAGAAPVHLADLATPDGPVDSAVFSPDGRLLATVGLYSRTVRLWDLTDPRDPRELPALTGHTGTVNTIVFDRRRPLLVSAGYDRTARLWDLSDPRHPVAAAVLRGHGNAVFTAVFSPDGRTLATAGQDTTVRLWDLADLADLARPRLLSVLTGHTTFVDAAAFSSDGRILATGGGEGAVRLWDVTAPGRPALWAVLTTNTEAVRGLVFAPVGRLLASGGTDGSIRLWDVDPGHLAARVCALAYPALSRADWDGYFSGVDYRPPCP